MRTNRRRSGRRFATHAFGSGMLAILVALAGLVSVSQSGHAQTVRSLTEPARLGDIYAQVGRANPKIAAARALVRAAQARIPGATKPPDPQLQLGIMNRSLPGLAPMQPLGMTQLQVMQMVPLGGKLGLAG